MRNLVFNSVKDVIARAVGMCPIDSRVRDLCNEAQERLLNRKDMPVGSLVPYRFCSRKSCLVLPRQVSTVEAYSVCGFPGVVFPLWYSTHNNGPGSVCPQDTSFNRAIDQGTVVSFENVNGNADGTDNYIRVYAQSAADVGKTIVLKFYRADTRAKQYSGYGGFVQEGEQITLVAPPAYAITSTTVMRNGLYGVIKAITDYPINLYEYDGTSNLRMLAWYEPSEEVPVYRKMFLPGLGQIGDCGNGCGTEPCDDSSEDETCVRVTIDTLVKLQHVPVIQDNDPLVIGNSAALKLMSMAIQREEQERLVESAAFEAKANAELDGERAAYLGTSTVMPIQVQGRETFGVGGNDMWGWASGW